MSYNEEAYSNHLQELHSSQFEVAKGEPDIRNWKVIGLQNQEVGTVKELLFDEVSHRVRYLVLRVNGAPLNLISRDVLVPVGLTELLKDEKVVIISGLTVGQLASLPTYEKGKITSVTEHAVRSAFSAGPDVVFSNGGRGGFYDHPHFNNASFSQSEIRRREEMKNEMRDNIERVKASVKKMEEELEKMSRTDR